MSLRLTFKLFIAVFCVYASAAVAQPLNFERFADEFGGRQSSVYGIAADPRGFLWFAGDTDGLLRYDGYQLTRWAGADDTLGRVSYSSVLYTEAEELWAASWGSGLLLWDHTSSRFHAFNTENSELADNRVQTLFEDSTGQVWVGTLNGLVAAGVDGITALDSSNPLHKERIWGVMEHDHELWFATTSGLYRTNMSHTQWQQYLPFPEQFGNNRINEIRTVQVIDERIWVGLDGGIFEFEPSTGCFLAVTFPASYQGLTRPQINFIYPQIGNRLWVGAENGLYSVDTENRQFVAHSDGEFVLVRDVDVRQIISDSSGALWLGSRDQGIFRSRPAGVDIRLVADQTPQPLQAPLQRTISTVYVAENQDVWFGISNGVVRFRASENDWRYWHLPSDLAQRRIETILTDGQGRTWVGSNGSLFYVDEGNETLVLASELLSQLNANTTAVTAMFEDAGGRLWIGFWGRGLAVVDYQQDYDAYHARWHFDVLSGLRGDLIYDIQEQPQQGLWLLTRFSGLWFKPEKSEQWVSIEQLMEQASWQGRLPSDGLLCLFFRTEHELWLCSEDGLLRVDFTRQVIERFGREHGLPSNRVLGMTEGSGIRDSENSVLWLITSRGLSAFEPESQQFLNFGPTDGLPAWEFSRAAIDINRNGEVFAGSVRGAVSFNPTQLQINQRAPQVGLSRVWVDDIDITGSLAFSNPTISLPRTHRSVVLQYSVLDFKAVGANAGRYRVLGLNNEWSPWSESRQLIFTSLPPGTFTIEIEGRNSLGIGTEQPLRIRVVVQRAWWASPWVWLASALMLITLFVLAMQLRLAALRRLNRRLDQQVKARTSELEVLAQELQEQSHSDYLTKLPNRRGFTVMFEAALARAKRSKQPLSLVLFDVDHFKQFNDYYGHEAGDAVLVEIARTVKQNLREQDVVGRWGGEEFAILLPDTSLTGAEQVCESLRVALAETIVPYSGQDLRVTATFGVYEGDSANKSLQKWMQYADAALYIGKSKGRNCVQCYET